jgi:N-methylhydantoinase A
VSPQFREFERFTTTAINAFVGPKVRSVCGRSRGQSGHGRAHRRPSHHGLERRRGDGRHGRRTPGADAAQRPCGGRARRRLVGRTVGRNSLITFDVGGTSADIGIVVKGRFAEATPRDTWIAGFPLMVPMIDIHTIGAGGGSIAYRDAGGAFRVGRARPAPSPVRQPMASAASSPP